jgi:hypothetical protein
MDKMGKLVKELGEDLDWINDRLVISFIHAVPTNTLVRAYLNLFFISVGRHVLVIV